MYLHLGGRRLPLGHSAHPIVLGRQEEEDDVPIRMPGFEDIILGRDFLSQQKLLLVVDFDEQDFFDFFVLLPEDHENQQRRERVRVALTARR